MPICPMKPRPIGVSGHVLEAEAKVDTPQEEVNDPVNTTDQTKTARLPQPIALNGTSAPGYGEKKSWANDLTKGAQLVSVRVLRKQLSKIRNA